MDTYFKSGLAMKVIILIAICFSQISNITAQHATELITEEVSFLNGETKLAGTFSFPSKESPYAAIVLMSGRGFY